MASLSPLADCARGGKTHSLFRLQDQFTVFLNDSFLFQLKTIPSLSSLRGILYVDYLGILVFCMNDYLGYPQRVPELKANRAVCFQFTIEEHPDLTRGDGTSKSKPAGVRNQNLGLDLMAVHPLHLDH